MSRLLPLSLRPGLALVVLLAGLASPCAQAQPVRTLTSPNPEESGYFGRSGAVVPDADGDGRDDVLVAAIDETVGGVQAAGRAYLFSGATGTLLRTLVSPNPADVRGRFGYAVAGVPDADGDGRGELLVAATGETVGGVQAAGRAYLFSGATGTLLRSLVSPNPRREGFFGGSVAGVPDADGDGRGELLVGAYGETVGGVQQAGRAYLFYGDGAVPVEELPGVPTETALRAPWPNPTTGGSVLSYDLAEAARVRLVVYDLLGREVAVLVDGSRPAGAHEVGFDASRLAPGLYVARLTAGTYATARRLTVTR